MIGSLVYVVGDVTLPVEEGMKILVQVCNDIGGYGAGVSGAISRRWKEVESRYRRWHHSGNDFALGEVQFVPVADDLIVANMIGQHGIGPGSDGTPPVRYEAIEACLGKVATLALEKNAQVIGPRFGAGLSMGNWQSIEELINRQLIEKGINVTIYDWGG